MTEGKESSQHYKEVNIRDNIFWQETGWASYYLIELEIRPFRLGSRIRDIEAESYNWSHLSVSI